MTVAQSIDALVESLCGDLSSIHAPRGADPHDGNALLSVQSDGLRRTRVGDRTHPLEH